jgi:hypothetical protein
MAQTDHDQWFTLTLDIRVVVHSTPNHLETPLDPIVIAILQVLHGEF